MIRALRPRPGPLPALALDCGPGQRPFAHAAGETCLLQAPQRIVAGPRDDHAGRLDRYRARVQDLRAALGDPSAVTVSRFDLFEGTIWYYPNWGAVDQVIHDLGLAHPAIVAGLTENAEFSVEMVPEFGADLVLSSHADHFGHSIATLTAQWDATAPFWREMEGVRDGNHFWYPRDVWVGYTFRSLDAVIDGLHLLAAGRLPS